MDWNGSFDSPPLESASSLLYNYNLQNQFPEMEMEQPLIVEEEGEQVLVGGMEKKKKKRLSNEQLECLERSFEEEMKLDTCRKMKLSKELGLKPRQIAVWFQNRRARWKSKQLEHLYNVLKHEFEAITREKHNLQQQVIELRSMLREQAVRNQVATAHTENSGEESCDSYIYKVEDFTQLSAPPFWDNTHLS